MVQQARRVLFKLQAQVDRKLDELEQLGVIVKKERPTPWISILVSIPKVDNNVRVCVDMRGANKAIQRERFPMPNVEETLEQMNGESVFFSKLD